MLTVLVLDETDIALLKTYVRCLHTISLMIPQGQGPYARELKQIEGELKDIQKRINERMGTLPSCHRVDDLRRC